MPRFSYVSFATLLLFLCICSYSAAPLIAGQEQTRSISTEDWANRRTPTRKKQKSKKGVKKYYFVRRTQNRPVANGQEVNPTTELKEPANLRSVDIGVTFWRLRAPKGREFGHFLPVLNDKGTKEFWLSERIAEGSTFNSGDKVRFAVESSVNGYLYVIAREIYTNRRFGRPMLIFPADLEFDNFVRPGILADIPSQDEELPYFKIIPKASGYLGELLSIIISPTKLEKFGVDKNGYVKDLDLLSEIEWNIDGSIFSRKDSVDHLFSETESQASCRIGIRSKVSCSSVTRELTRDDPTPQSLYRITSVKSKPSVAFVRMDVRLR